MEKKEYYILRLKKDIIEQCLLKEVPKDWTKSETIEHIDTYLQEVSLVASRKIHEHIETFIAQGVLHKDGSIRRRLPEHMDIKNDEQMRADIRQLYPSIYSKNRDRKLISNILAEIEDDAWNYGVSYALSQFDKIRKHVEGIKVNNYPAMYDDPLPDEAKYGGATTYKWYLELLCEDAKKVSFDEWIGMANDEDVFSYAYWLKNYLRITGPREFRVDCRDHIISLVCDDEFSQIQEQMQTTLTHAETLRNSLHIDRIEEWDEEYDKQFPKALIHSLISVIFIHEKDWLESNGFYSGDNFRLLTNLQAGGDAMDEIERLIEGFCRNV